MERSLWKKLGAGNFNDAYVDHEADRVLKIQKKELCDSDLLLDIPERSVRLWNEINSDLTPKAELIETSEVDASGATKKVLAWTAPFIRGRDSNMNEVAKAVVDIFNRTGRVVLDACVHSNFKTVTLPDGTEKTICIDIGMSLKLQRDELTNESFTSLNAWNAAAKDSYIPWFKNLEKSLYYRDIIQLTKTLFELQSQHPYITNAAFLTEPTNVELRNALASSLEDPDSFNMQKSFRNQSCSKKC